MQKMIFKTQNRAGAKGKWFHKMLVRDVAESLQCISFDSLVYIHNEIASDWNYEHIYDTGEFFDLERGAEPSEIANRAVFGDYRPYADYIMLNGYGNYQSIECSAELFRRAISETEIAEWILENENDFDEEHIRDAMSGRWNV